MAEIGYTMMSEQRSPRNLVRDLVRAEAAGFDFSVTSDHFHPWLEEQGHSGYAWSILGAAAQATESIPLLTYVTCPLFRYHPAVVAQKAATMSLLSGGRFSLSLGAGENLNEHVIGRDWPPVDVRHEMLREASGEGKPGVAQIAVCWGPDEAECRRLAREQFRWAAGGWKVQAELPNPANFDAASQYVTEEDMAQIVPCGPAAEGIVEGVRQFVEAGFERVALVQVGDRQEEFCEFYERELGETLRQL